MHNPYDHESGLAATWKRFWSPQGGILAPTRDTSQINPYVRGGLSRIWAETRQRPTRDNCSAPARDAVRSDPYRRGGLAAIWSRAWDGSNDDQGPDLHGEGKMLISEKDDDEYLLLFDDEDESGKRKKTKTTDSVTRITCRCKMRGSLL